MNERRILDECKWLDKKGLHEDAAELLSQAIANTPSAPLYCQRALHYECLGEYEKAFDDFSAAAQLEPDQMFHWQSRGVLLCQRLGRPADALQDFKRALSADPSSSVLHQHLSLCYLQLGDSDAASDHAERAIDLDGSDAYSYYCLGQCRLAAERYHSAAKQFETALRLEPRCARFWIGLCDASAGTGDLEKSQECCEKAIGLEPSAMSYIQLAEIQLGVENAEGAIESLKAASEFDLNEIERTLVGGYLEVAKQRL